MRVAIVADIHGNRGAFDAVLADCRKRVGCRKFCLPDNMFRRRDEFLYLNNLALLTK